MSEEPEVTRLDMTTDTKRPDFAAIRQRAEKATPGPWLHCEKCKCSGVLSADHPVCDVTKGKWGDDFPAVRLVGNSPLDYKVEAYMEMYEYGELDEATFLANRDFIAASRTDVPALCDEVDRLTARIAGLEAERDRWKDIAGKRRGKKDKALHARNEHRDAMLHWQSRAEAAETERDRLREALRPFADTPYATVNVPEEMVEEYAICKGVTVGDLRRARTALGGSSHE